MTYLELVQTLASEGGVVPGAGPAGSPTANPASLGAANGLVLKMSAWVKRAWIDIQTARDDWQWLRGEFTGALTSGTARYSATDLGVTRWQAWLPAAEDGTSNFSIYKTSLGAADEGMLAFEAFSIFYQRLRGTQPVNGKPTVCSVDREGKLVFWPTPDAAYTVRGLYRRSPQVLTGAADTPEMPEAFHNLIWIRAAFLADAYDEAPDRLSIWQADEQRYWQGLIHAQTDPFWL